MVWLHENLLNEGVWGLEEGLVVLVWENGLNRVCIGIKYSQVM